MATLIKTDGTKQEVRPKEGEKFSLEEMQGFVGGTIDIQEMADLRPRRQQLVLNDEGKLIGLPINEEASRLWREAYPIEKYPHNNDGLIVGDVLIASPREVGDDTCPGCQDEIVETPALSRYGFGEICPACGTREAMEGNFIEKEEAI